MASTSRRFRTRGLPVAADSAIRAQPCVVRTWDGAGHVGLSSTRGFGARDGKGPTDEARHRAINTLVDLIEGTGGGAERDISQRLLIVHGSLHAVLRAYSPNGRSSVDIPTAVVMRLQSLSDALEQSLADDAGDELRLGSLSALMRYLQFELGDKSREIFRVFHLDAGNRLLRDSLMWEGTVDRVQVHIREIVREALECGAAALILVHNHPHGDVQPSNTDMEVTRKVEQACRAFDIRLLDHLIVGRRDVFSMARAGFLSTSSSG